MSKIGIIEDIEYQGTVSILWMTNLEDEDTTFPVYIEHRGLQTLIDVLGNPRGIPIEYETDSIGVMTSFQPLEEV
ncbi:MAG: hypothetical protein WC476_01655 [Phycisphaerae bacterium]|jgi:hypothetical protein